MIASARTNFVTTTELIVGRMRKQIGELQGNLYASEQRFVRVEEDRRRLEEENTNIHLAHLSAKELQALIKE